MTCEPIMQRPRAGAAGSATHVLSLSFVSPAAAAAGVGEAYDLDTPVVPVEGTRTPTKADMVHNDYCPDDIDIDPETFAVTVEGDRITCEPSDEIALAQRYLL
jgi:urease subunit alpha